MVFVDNLAYALFLLSFSGFLILYVVTSIYLSYRKKERDFSAILSAAKVPIAVVGAYMVILGMVSQFTWPLPGSYNILFFDPLVSFGLIMVAFALSIHYKIKFDNIGFFGLMIGIMTIIYGIQGYNIGLTSEPFALLILYFLYGITGVFSYPVSIIMERLPGIKKDPWIGWTVCIVIFWLALLASSLISGYIGYMAIPVHLASAP
jgi:putative membrane protein